MPKWGGYGIILWLMSSKGSTKNRKLSSLGYIEILFTCVLPVCTHVRMYPRARGRPRANKAKALIQLVVVPNQHAHGRDRREQL